MEDELPRNVPEVTVGPPDMPDPGNCADVGGSCLADNVWFGRCGLVYVH
jgi:hypothetical protein